MQMKISTNCWSLLELGMIFFPSPPSFLLSFLPPELPQRKLQISNKTGIKEYFQPGEFNSPCPGFWIWRWVWIYSAGPK